MRGDDLIGKSPPKCMPHITTVERDDVLDGNYCGESYLF